MEISTNAYTNYNALSAYLNKDNLSYQLRQSSQLFQDEVKEKNNQKMDEHLQQQELDKQRAAAVYFNYQNVQSQHNRIDLYLENQNNETQEDATLTYSDIHEMQEQKNRNKLLELYANDYNESDSSIVNIRV